MVTPTRTIVMTGATRGIGRQAAISLLRAAPDVQLVVLARSRSETLAAELGQASGNPHVRSIATDLTSLASIRATTARLRHDLEQGILPPLTGLIGNAGVQLLRATDTTADGHETTFGVNVLANHVLIDELCHHFAPDGRILVTTSDTHFGDFKHTMGFVPAPVWRDPHALATPGTALDADGPTAGRTAYSTSKLALIYLVHALARRLPENVEVYSFNPGLVPGTGLVDDAGAISRFMFARVMPLMTLTPFARSATTSGGDLAGAMLQPVAAASGSYINGSKPENSSPESYDHQREEALWTELTHLAVTADKQAGR